ncbi:restriction endonuclease [Actinomadura madurae]|uniref:restriction endonuclease n=1 Tax=Actinomadura madurae TaxID=1993 RepID=UPI002026C3B8|nr:restriction endonuclease [Actinomadura madurae]URN06358.1 restriction endonuclease [Actinomadura madurae]
MATVARMQREAESAAAARRRAEAAAQREAARARAAYERARAADEKERKRLYFEARVAEVAAQNESLAQRLEELDSILVSGLRTATRFNLNRLKEKPNVKPFDPGPAGHPEPPPWQEAFLPPPQTGVAKLFGGARHEEQVRQGQLNYQRACAEHAQREQARQATLSRLQQEHSRRTNEAEERARRQHAEVETFKRDLAEGRPDAVAAYFDLVLNAVSHPDGFPAKWRMAYVPESAQLVVEYDLPTIEVVPTVKTYRYVKTSDSVTETRRAAAQIKSQYTSVISQVALRVVRDLFEADTAGHVTAIVFNGMVDTIDAATGRPVRPCLLTLRTTRESFSELDLARVEPAACLKHLGAGVSRNSAELSPVRPVLEFSMVDPRFVEETDVLGELDERPNLLEMSPTEFEGLIQNLFARMGLETRQTRPSRDGGVDCVAYDPRPIMGGKVVIQAKRYRNTVGVSAVRDLYGTLQNEGASKGILVTTSGYGQASFDFAKNKPIELLDGANLLYLLKEHAEVDARIEAPEGWRDPDLDRADSEAPPSALRPGENVKISAPAVLCAFVLPSPDHDPCALLLNHERKVRSDADFIFYNQPVSADGAVKLDTAVRQVQIDLARLATDVSTVLLVTSGPPGAVRLTVTGRDGTAHALAADATTETVLVCAEIYRRKGGWRLRAVGQGYADGLAGLARDHGVVIE